MKIRKSIKEASTDLLRDIKEHPWKYDTNDEESKQIYEEVCEELRKRPLKINKGKVESIKQEVRIKERKPQKTRIAFFTRDDKKKEEIHVPLYGYIVLFLIFLFFCWICIELTEEDSYTKLGDQTALSIFNDYLSFRLYGSEYEFQNFNYQLIDARRMGGPKYLEVEYIVSSISKNNLSTLRNFVVYAYLGAVDQGWDIDEIMALVKDIDGNSIETWYCNKEWTEKYANGNLTLDEVYSKVDSTAMFIYSAQKGKKSNDKEYQDSEYIAWFRKTSDKITFGILDPLGKAAWNLDYERVGTYGGRLNTEAKEALKEIDHFKISSKLIPSKNEFKLALLDWEKAGYYAWRGAKNFSGDDLNLSADYMESAIRHWDRASALLP